MPDNPSPPPAAPQSAAGPAPAGDAVATRGPSSTSGPRYVLAGGGTGGHLFPGIAVAAALKARHPMSRIDFFTSNRPLDEQLLAPGGFRRTPQPVRPFSSRPWHWPRFWWSWRQSVALAAKSFIADPPAAVLGLGGFAAGPAVVAAARQKISVGLLNPDALAGRANRYLARFAERIFIQWPGAFPGWPAERIAVVGCPVRPAFRAVDPAVARQVFELDVDRPVLLVTGASQGARTINQALAIAWPVFVARHPDWQLLHLTGPLDQAECEAAYAAAGVEATVLAFTHEMPAALAASDVVISRAGASTLAELTALGRPSILLPYPYHRDQHQAANAHVLAECGAAIQLTDQRDPRQNAGALEAALERLADSQERERMSAAARELGRPDAADTVAAWLAERAT